MKLTKQELAESLETLRDIRGRHTELISVYISKGYDINAVQRQLEAEKSTAKNIKSPATRKNVSEALDKIVRHLKEYKDAPENGLVIFCGNVSEVEGQSDLQLWDIEPPEEVNTRLYRCDKEFVLEPLQGMVEVSEIYGLIVLDRKEATIGMLSGKKIEVIQNLHSGIPSKVRAGGQCLSPDTLIMKDNGDIIEIRDSHNPLFVMSENFNKEKSEKTPVIAKWENNKQLFKITTCYPKFEIKSSEEHTFFVRTKKGIEEKPLSEINKGDYLIMPEKIDLKLEDQKINFFPLIKQYSNMKKINIPEKIDKDISKLLGYYLGDGSYEKDRITFFEQREEVAKKYKHLIKKVFGIDSVLSFRESKNYWQLRVYSRIISQFFKHIFADNKKTLNERIPSIVLQSSDKSLASFISGFFDAEGYVSKNRVAFGINNKFLTQQFQFALLRLGIISSINEYDNKMNPYSNNIRYTLAIDDLESLKRFYNLIGFFSEEKSNLVKQLINNRGNRNKVRQLIVNGSEVAKIIRNSGLNTRDFHCGYFFCNKRQMSKEVFKERILNKTDNLDLKKRLELFYNSNLIAIKISKIEPLNLEKTIDIETKNHNFLANCLIVHNSSQRFHRITEGLTKDFYKRIAEETKKAFFENPKLKGILVGGPVPTKDEFLDNDHLTTQLKEKVLGRVDLGDTSESGLDELVERSHEILKNQELVEEKQLLEKFFENLGKSTGLAVYTDEKLDLAFNCGAIETLLVSKDFDKTKLSKLKKKVEETGSEIKTISKETPEGEQFSSVTKGVGALLRFSL